MGMNHESSDLTEKFVREMRELVQTGAGSVVLNKSAAGQLIDAWLTLNEARKLCAEQAEDEGLWCTVERLTEDMLQSNLRALHRVVETGMRQPVPPVATIEDTPAELFVKRLAKDRGAPVDCVAVETTKGRRYIPVYPAIGE